MTIEEITTDDLLQLLGVLFVDEEDGEELLADAAQKVNRWIERGDSVAVYENLDLSSIGLGEPRIVSWGSPEAQIEVERVEDLPTRLPDGIGGDINWRFVLVGIYTGSETL